MLLKLKDPEQSATIKEKWKKEKAPCYVKPSHKKGYVSVYAYPKADPVEAMLFLINHLDMPEQERRKRKIALLAFTVADTLERYENYISEIH